MLPPKRLKGRRSRRARARQVKPRQLMPAAVPVRRRFFAMAANKPFPSSSLRRSVKRAIRANTERAHHQLPPIPETLRLYDLMRHTFGTEVFRFTKNLKLVMDLDR